MCKIVFSVVVFLLLLPAEIIGGGGKKDLKIPSDLPSALQEQMASANMALENLGMAKREKERTERRKNSLREDSTRFRDARASALARHEQFHEAIKNTHDAIAAAMKLANPLSNNQRVVFSKWLNEAAGQFYELAGDELRFQIREPKFVRDRSWKLPRF